MSVNVTQEFLPFKLGLDTDVNVLYAIQTLCEWLY